VAEITHDYPTAEIILTGDLNQLRDDDLIERTGLTQIVSQPTRDASLLDRIFISDPQLYPVVRVVTSVVKGDHKAVVAIPEGRTYPSATPDKSAHSVLRRLRRMPVSFNVWPPQISMPD